MNDEVLIWVVFVVLGSVFTTGHKMLQDKTIKALSYSLGVIMWLVAAYVWAITYSDTGLFPVIWVHLIPILLLSSWALFDERDSGKRDKYE